MKYSSSGEVKAPDIIRHCMSSKEGNNRHHDCFL